MMVKMTAESQEPLDQRLLAVVDSFLKSIHRTPKRLTLQLNLLDDLGLDSLTQFELLRRVEEHFGVSFVEERVLGAPSLTVILSELRRAINKKKGIAPDAVLPAAPDELKAASYSKDSATLVEALQWHADEHGERVHIYLLDEEDRYRPISYQELYRDARNVASRLLAKALGPGQCVALMLPTSREMLVAFFAVQLAGGTPVPLYPPSSVEKIEEHLKRQIRIIQTCKAQFLITLHEALPFAPILKAQCPELRSVMIGSELNEPAPSAPLRLPSPATPAFVQFTSGSTGAPKGVVLTHSNLISNIKAMGEASDVMPDDVFVSWLPLYHDMGLIGAWLGSLFFGMPLVLMSPLQFLSKPGRWFRAITNFRGTLSAAPNFAYQLCADRFAGGDLSGIDLSSWRLAFNGAEPVSPQTVRLFAERFQTVGFRPEAMTPVYGLAENSVGLCFPPLNRGPLIDRVQREALFSHGRAEIAAADDAAAIELVSCGKPIPEHHVRIVDPNSNELAERVVGRLQFKGPSATAGYMTSETAAAKLFDGDWLESGDYAYRARGEIFIAGRMKDIIIRAGRNIYPQEIEEALGRIEGIRRGCVAVFPTLDQHAQTEKLVVVAETKGTIEAAERERVITEIKQVVTGLVELPPDHIRLIRPRMIPKTSSGKIRRAECRRRYETGELDSSIPPWLQITKLTLTSIPIFFRSAFLKAWTSIPGLLMAGAFLGGGAVSVPILLMLPTLRSRRIYLRYFSRLLLWLGRQKLTVAGLEYLPANGGFVAVSHHASYLDAIVLTAALPPEFTYVAKGEFRSNKLMRFLFTLNSTEYIDRRDVKTGMEDTQRFINLLAAGNSLLFFPEGTFFTAAGVMPFKIGAFLAAVKAGVPIVPIALAGTRLALRADKSLPAPADLKVTVRPPINAQDYRAVNIGHFEQASFALQRAREQIVECSEEPDFEQPLQPLQAG